MSIPVPRSSEKLVKPAWLKVKAPGSPEYMKTRETVKGLNLVTVCEEAMCPNIGECWENRTATFMIMGEFCTRRCNFCNVQDGTEVNLEPLDKFEPNRVGLAIKRLGLKHAVVTSVDRDDQKDLGAGHFAQTARAIRAHAPDCRIEFLIPDMAGSKTALETIVAENITILNHNVETVPRLYRKVRPKAGYIRSLSILKWAKELAPKTMTKSGIMVGLGETKEEVFALMDDLLAVGVDIMTIGQYLRPSKKQMPVKFFVTPEEFKEYEEVGKEKGFKFIESGAFVRSSYHAWKHSVEEPY